MKILILLELFSKNNRENLLAKQNFEQDCNKTFFRISDNDKLLRKFTKVTVKELGLKLDVRTIYTVPVD